ncbi:MAG TPA: hypothetical protein DDY13_16615 [Cytophagales bacterium]|jgi:hypothetical protein|nr:hypothetical protein [Cytophagales bacterium]
MERTVSVMKKKESTKAGSFVHNLFCTLAIVFILLFPYESIGQEKAIKIYPTAGITWRSTAMNFFNFKAVIPADPTKPYSYEKNVQGFSINPGLQIRTRNIGFEYYSNLRYDVIYSRLESENVYVKEFIVDHNFNLVFKRKIDFGVGLTFVNAGKGYEFVNPVPRYHNIEFKTYNAFVTIPIKKVINLEIKALYIPEDFPENPNEQYIMYSLRAYYKFDFLNKRKE